MGGLGKSWNIQVPIIAYCIAHVVLCSTISLIGWIYGNKGKTKTDSLLGKNSQIDSKPNTLKYYVGEIPEEHIYDPQYYEQYKN